MTNARQHFCDGPPLAAGTEPGALAADTAARLRVVLVSTQRGWHGGEEQAFQLARGLRRGGHECHVLARRGATFARRMADDGFEVAALAGNGRNPLAVAQVRRHLVRIRPQVVHANESHALTCAGLASWGLRVPARIVSRRVCYPIRSTLRFHYLCDQVICVSGAVARMCRETGIAANRISLVHSGVDPQRMASGDRPRGRRTLNLRHDQRLLLCVAALVDAKGHKYLLQAMPEVLRRHDNLRLALAGDGELASSLKKQARRLGIDDRVCFLGYRRDAADLMMAADLFVLPSCVEGLGTSLIDAMLAGRPIVTTSAGGIGDLLGGVEAAGEPTAWVVPPRDPQRLAAAILEALDSPEECLRRRQRAERRARRLFTAEKMVEATLAVYREVLDRAAASRAPSAA